MMSMVPEEASLQSSVVEVEKLTQPDSPGTSVERSELAGSNSRTSRSRTAETLSQIKMIGTIQNGNATNQNGGQNQLISNTLPRVGTTRQNNNNVNFHKRPEDEMEDGIFSRGNSTKYSSHTLPRNTNLFRQAINGNSATIRKSNIREDGDGAVVSGTFHEHPQVVEFLPDYPLSDGEHEHCQVETEQVYRPQMAPLKTIYR